MRRSAIITGASRGIGRATALALAGAGYDLLICYKKEESAARAVCREAEGLGVRALPFCMDMESLGDIRRTVAKAMMEFGRIDLLVANAGIALPALLTQTAEEEYDRLMNVNTKGVFFLAKETAREMIAAGGGNIVLLSSMWGLVGAAGEAAYSMSKAAIIGMTKSLAKELAPSHIRVNCVAPGVIDTDMNACYDGETLAALSERTPLARLGTPEDVACAIAFFASDASSFVTGQTLCVDGGFIL